MKAPRITYLSDSGEERAVEVAVGLTVMQGAMRNGVCGIVVECGGDCACGACRVYVDEAWRARTGEASAIEEATMEIRDDRRDGKRLSCQIKVTEQLDGLIVRMPESQW